MNSKNFCYLDKLISMVSQYDFQDGEIFKSLNDENCSNRYLVSNYGTIITLYYNTWKVMKPWKSKKDGHLYIKLTYNGKRTNKGVHQLVAECFIDNDNPTVKTQIHHIDFNPLNNRADNLMYVSPKEHSEIHKKHNKEVMEKRLKEDASRENS